MEAVDVRGRFVWHHLLTRDVPGAKKFYSSLTRWNAQTWPLDPNYTVCRVGEIPTASMMAMAPEFPADVPPQWMTYIGTRDVDGTAEAAVLAGGYIVKQPSDLKGAGRYAVLADPQGAVFAIIDPENARAEAPGTAPLGQFSWHELATSDLEAAFAFYSNLFGWDAMQRMDMGPMGVYLIFGYNGEQRGGMYNKLPEMPGQPHWLPYSHVPSVDAAVPAVEGAGGKIIQAPMEVPGGSRIAVILDPAGAMFALHSNAEPASAAVAKPKASSGKSNVATKAKAKAKAGPQTKSKPKSKAKAKAEAKPKAVVRKKAPGKSKGKAKPKAQVKSKARANPKAKSKAKKKVVRRKK